MAPPTVELFARPDIEVETRADGVRILRSRVPLQAPPATIGDVLARQAEAIPTQDFLAERAPDGQWRRVTYGEAWDAARSIGQALLDRGLGPERTVVALSGNGVDHALLMLGCCVSGVPFTPVSAAYSLLSTDRAKVRHIAGKVRPGLVYAASAGPFGPALDAAGLRTDAEVVTSEPDGATTSFADLRAVGPDASLAGAMSRVGPDTVAKYLFTSGSTGVPKGVPNTHRMLCSNQQSIRQVWPFLAESPPVLIDWLPWSHTFGGNHNFNLTLFAGGTLHVDAGKPTPALLPATLANLRDVSPTVYFNVPAGYAALVTHLEQDPELAASFFHRLELIFYAAAALPLETWRRLEDVARATTGRDVPMTSSWGATETAPAATTAHFPLDGPGNIGVPLPGVEVKVVPSGAKAELRVRGPNVMAGYLDEPAHSAEAFDEEGFYRMGDAGRFADPDDPTRGLLFDGRLAEDFKLSTGTWVSVTTVRTGIVSAAAPLVLDAVITGHDRDEIGALVWIDPGTATSLFGCEGTPEEIAGSAPVRRHLAEAVKVHNDTAGGSSLRIRRLLVLVEPPSIDANEITDKGYVNQRAVLEHRAHLVEQLHAATDPRGAVVVAD